MNQRGWFKARSSWAFKCDMCNYLIILTSNMWDHLHSSDRNWNIGSLLPMLHCIYNPQTHSLISISISPFLTSLSQSHTHTLIFDIDHLLVVRSIADTVFVWHWGKLHASCSSNIKVNLYVWQMLITLHCAMYFSSFINLGNLMIEQFHQCFTNNQAKGEKWAAFRFTEYSNRHKMRT